MPTAYSSSKSRSSRTRRKSHKLAPNTARQVARISRKVVDRTAEKKYHIGTLTSTAIDYNGSIVSLSTIAQGDTGTTRDGTNIYTKSLQMKYKWVVGDTHNMFRVVVFQWYAPTTPVAGDVIHSGSLATVEAPLAPISTFKRTSFRILYDKLMVGYNEAGGGVWSPLQVNHLLLTKFGKRKIVYDDSAGTAYNKIYVLLLSDSSAVSHPTCQFVSKLNFQDM